jgi:hypothetical protein
MEYTEYDIQTTGSIGSIREHRRNVSIQSNSISPYDSFKFNSLYTLELLDSVLLNLVMDSTFGMIKNRRLDPFMKQWRLARDQ